MDTPREFKFRQAWKGCRLGIRSQVATFTRRARAGGRTSKNPLSGSEVKSLRVVPRDKTASQGPKKKGSVDVDFIEAVNNIVGSEKGTGLMSVLANLSVRMGSDDRGQRWQVASESEGMSLVGIDDQVARMVQGIVETLGGDESTKTKEELATIVLGKSLCDRGVEEQAWQARGESAGVVQSDGVTCGPRCLFATLCEMAGDDNGAINERWKNDIGAVEALFLQEMHKRAHPVRASGGDESVCFRGQLVQRSSRLVADLSHTGNEEDPIDVDEDGSTSRAGTSEGSRGREVPREQSQAGERNLDNTEGKQSHRQQGGGLAK